MAPKLTAAAFQSLYGNLCSEHFAQYTSARTLRIALSERDPPIFVTDGMLKVWFATLRSTAPLYCSALLLHSTARHYCVALLLCSAAPRYSCSTALVYCSTAPLYRSALLLRSTALLYCSALLLRSTSPLYCSRRGEYVFSHEHCQHCR